MGLHRTPTPGSISPAPFHDECRPHHIRGMYMKLRIADFGRCVYNESGCWQPNNRLAGIIWQYRAQCALQVDSKIFSQFHTGSC